MPSRIDEAGHTKALVCTVAEHRGSGVERGGGRGGGLLPRGRASCGGPGVLDFCFVLIESQWGIQGGQG